MYFRIAPVVTWKPAFARGPRMTRVTTTTFGTTTTTTSGFRGRTVAA